MRTTLAFLAVAVPALLLLGWNLGWYNIVRGSQSVTRWEADGGAAQTGDYHERSPGATHKNAANETDNVNFNGPNKQDPIPRPFLRAVDGPVFPR
jgi:hypothetical protein